MFSSKMGLFVKGFIQSLMISVREIHKLLYFLPKIRLSPIK